MANQFKDLNDFLINHSADSNGPTHTRIPDRGLNIYGGSYSIVDTDMDEFYKHYHNKVFVNGQSEYLTEKQLDDLRSPIAIDIDLRYPITTESRQHTHGHILDLLDLYFSEIATMMKLDSNTSIPVYIMEKPNVNIVQDKNVTKDGIHMIIGLQMCHVLQQILRKRVVSKIGTIWDDLPITNTWNDVFDEGITTGKTNWQLYGSKKPGHEAYKITYCYDVTYDENDSQFSTKNVKPESIDLKKNLHKISVRYTNFPKFELTSTMQEEYLRACSGQTKRTAPARRLRVMQDAGDASEEISLNAINNMDTLEKALNMQLDLLPKDQYYVKETHYYTQILPPQYYEPGSHLLSRKVAFGLKDTHECLFLSWVMLRSKASDFDYGSIPELYTSWTKHFKNGNRSERITRRSIIFWAKRDASPEDFERVRNSTVDKYVEETITQPTDFDFAQVLYCLYNDRYLCNGIQKPVWYVFENHRWTRDEGESLRLKMSQEMHGIYQKKIDQYTEDLRIATENENQEQIESCKKKMLHVSQAQIKLKRTSDKNNILKEANSLFYDKMFKKMIDTNRYLLGFNNGVVDFKNKCFRPGCPSDYITKNTGIDYQPLDSSSSDKDTIEQIERFMKQLFPDKELHEYVWDHLASVMIGTNLNQTFNLYRGSGSNGKSKLVELMEHVLGEYAGSVPLSLVCDKRPSIGGTSSELVALKGLRYGIMQEPSKGMILNEGPMKQITGGDKIQGRALYAESETFELQIKLCVCTNTLFEINTTDDGTWRRIRVVDFKSKFVDSIDPDNKEEYQFIKDRTLDDKIPDWAPIFASMLVKRAFATEGRVEDCEMVLAASKKYRQGEDHIAAFVDEKIIRTGCETDRISKRNIQEEFKLWFITNEGNRKQPKGKELIEYMDKKFGSSKSIGWIGIKLNVVEKAESLEAELDMEV